MKKKKNNVNHMTIISIIIVLLVLFLTIGWSSFNSSLKIDSMAMVRIVSDVRVTGFNSTVGNNSGTSGGEDYNVDSLSGSISLPNSNSTVTYKVEITNMELATNTYMGIKSLTGLPSNLKIVSMTDYTFKEKICDDNDATDCGSGAQKTFYITIGYQDNNSYDANNTEFGFIIDVEFKKVFDIHYSGFANPPISPITVMDGDTPTITLTGAGNNIIVSSGGNTLVSGNNYTYSNGVLTFITPVRDHLYISNPTVYTITYILDGGTQANNQVTTYTLNDNQTILSPTKSGSIFGGWYLNSDFTGDDIRNTNQISGNVTLYAYWVNKKARIGSTYYDTLQAAITAAQNNVETTVELLDNTSEVISVASSKKIILDLKNNTVSNSGNNPVITNNGLLTISNGTITSSANQGAINNNGTLNMTGGTISATGERQAIYNGGILNISGGTMTSTTNQRATVQNLAAGNITITGGTINSSGGVGLENNGTLNVGAKGHGVNTQSPSIKGITYGIEAKAAFNYYDGIIGGKTEAIDDETKITELEPNYELTRTTSDGYKEVYLTTSYIIVVFEYDGGVETELTRCVTSGQAIGTLPTTSKAGFVFLGWFDDDNTGNQVDENMIINGATTLYAHWKRYTVARIGTIEYVTLPEAFDAITDNTPTTIVLLRDVSLTSKQTIPASRNITLDLNGHNADYNDGTIFENFGTFNVIDTVGTGIISGGKLSGTTFIPAVNNKAGATMTLSSGNIYSNASQVFENNGTFYMTGGNISIGDIVQGVLNNNANATLNMSGGSITATIAGSKRQAVYNKGTANISGNAVLTSASTDRATVQNDATGAVINISGGTITSTNTACQRGAVQNVNKATVNITGGTIISKSTNNNSGAVQNAGTLTIGVKDGNISATSPELISAKYGVNSNGTFKFYDGVLKGETNSIKGNIAEMESGSTRNDTTEIIDGVTYYVTYLS